MTAGKCYLIWKRAALIVKIHFYQKIHKDYRQCFIFINQFELYLQVELTWFGISD
jgi:hypothetical protein